MNRFVYFTLLFSSLLVLNMKHIRRMSSIGWLWPNQTQYLLSFDSVNFLIKKCSSNDLEIIQHARIIIYTNHTR